jgi:hypothetical protein
MGETLMRTFTPVVLVWMWVVAGVLVGSESPRGSNRLAGSTSGYLKSAAQQPVEWYSWGPEAWRRAKEMDRPILLDLGRRMVRMVRSHGPRKLHPAAASWFHQCQFYPGEGRLRSPARLAAELERAQALLNLPSGLPLTGFVTPDGMLYFGGSYFPHEAKGDKPAFEDVLKKTLRLYREHRPQIEREGVSVRRET